jgi:hypothetical protein
MDQEVAFLANCAVWLLVFGLAAGGLLGVFIRRRRPTPDHVESYWRQGE